MKLKHLLNLALFISLPSAMIAGGENPIIKEIAPFVSPMNRTNSPSRPVYMPDGETYLMKGADGRTIVKYSIATGKEIETIFNCNKTRETSIDSFQGFSVSPDGSRLLIYRNYESIYRHSFKAEYFVFEISRNILLPLSKDHNRQQVPVFSNDGNMVAFVADNNIYLRKLIFNTEIPVTTDGKYNEIINGLPDWVYEEEFKATGSIVWSPDNTTLCYLKYNESQVPLYSLPIYDSYCTPDSRYSLYPGSFTYKYPVAGEKNSIVTLHSYDIDTRKTKNIVFEDSKIEYIPRIAYVPEGTQLIVSTLNREQNRLEIYSVNPKSTVVKSILVEESNTWVEPTTYEDMSLEKNNFVIKSNRSGYTHLYSYAYSGALVKQLTSGDFDVTAYYGKDRLGNIYFQSTASGPINRVISKIDYKTGKTIDITEKEGTSNATFSPGLGYYMLSYSNSHTPPVYKLFATAKNKELRILEENREVGERYKNVVKKEFFTINSDGNQLNAYMIKPRGFSESKKYPVIMFQYSGPGSQQVLNNWAIDWMNYAAEQGYIIVCVDGRGTGGRGRDFTTIVYKNLGHYETIDQTNAARHLASLPYVDGNRIGITGWSYGGYETLMCLSAENSPFKAGVSIAPVTSWRLYDSIYTERYMSTPQINNEGYETSSPLTLTSGMNSELLLIYGTADDNVHPANSVEYVSSLQANNRLCSMLLFPNMNHSINGCNSRAQVYAAMMNFFNNNL